jgi:hypothetical protein
MSSLTSTRSSTEQQEASEPPYPGPRPFKDTETDRFFGRRREVKELASLVRSHHIVLVHAESGTGKTSLIEAGLKPELQRRGGCIIFPTARVRGEGVEPLDHPTKNVYVNNVIARLLDGLVVEESLESLSEALSALSVRNQGEELLRVVVIDQLEELFLSFPERWTERQDFFQQIREACDKDALLRFVLAIRDDYLGRLQSSVGAIADELRTRYRLERLRREEALEAIKLPAEGTDRRFSDEAAEILADELLAIEFPNKEQPRALGEFVEPVELQIVCRDLWSNIPASAVIQPDDVRNAFPLKGVLSRFYSEVLGDTVQHSHVREHRLREWFGSALITPGRTRGLLYRDEKKTGGLPNRAVNLLEQKRIIRSEQRGDARWYELTHDRLVDAVLESNQAWFNRRRRRRVRQTSAGLAIMLLLAGASIALSAQAPDLQVRRFDLGTTTAQIPSRVIEQREVHDYILRTTGPGLTAVTIRSSKEAYLKVIGREGEELGSEDYRGQDSQSLYSVLLLGPDKRYRVRASLQEPPDVSQDGLTFTYQYEPEPAGGTYSLRVSRPPVEALPAEGVDGSIEDQTEVDLYRVDPAKDEVLLFRLDPKGMQPWLDVYLSDGWQSTVTSSDSGAVDEAPSELLHAHRSRDGRTLYIAVTGSLLDNQQNGSMKGTYRLSFLRVPEQ